MNEHNPLGCGRFSDLQWSQFVTFRAARSKDPATDGVAKGMGDKAHPEAAGPGFDKAHPATDAPDTGLAAHVATCAPCRDEWESFAALAAGIDGLYRGRPPTTETFVDRVLTAVQRAERQPDRRHEAPRRRRPASGRTWWSPQPVLAAVMLALVAVLGVGLWSGPGVIPWSRSEPPAIVSSGEVLPGGSIKSAVSGGPGTVRAAALGAHAEAVAVSAGDVGEAGAAQEGGSRAIRATRGAHVGTRAGTSDGLSEGTGDGTRVGTSAMNGADNSGAEAMERGAPFR